MSVLLAALDDSVAARPVLAVARRIAPYLGADVVAVHVQEHDSGETARAAASASGVTLLARQGEVVAELEHAQHELHALAIVVGARNAPSGTRPCGHVARGVAEELATAVIVVPPFADDREIKRVVVAVEGDGESDALVAVTASLADRPGPEVIALHVFEPDSLPPFGDDPVHETEARAREFLRRAAVAPIERVRLEVRVGDAVDVFAGAGHDLDADLVMLAWHCDLSGGHGRVVRRVLESSTVPVVLLPVDRPALLARRRAREEHR